MNYEKRLAALEKFFCTKIIEDYKRALASTSVPDDVPNLNDLDEDKLVGKRAQTAMDDINLLTHEERMKYDPEYAHQEKIKLQKEKEVIESNSRKATDKKVPWTNNTARKMKNCHSRKPGNIEERPKQESQREEN
ncbi:MAG: hypothetical protein ABFD24_03755, partial [Anaerolineaceae bacterium]